MGARERLKMDNEFKVDIRELIKTRENSDELKHFGNPIKNLKTNPAQAMSLEAKAHGLMSRGDFNKAENLFLQAADSYENKDQRKARCLRNIAMINEKLERFNLSIDYYNQAAYIYGKNTPNSERCLNNIEQLKKISNPQHT